MASDALSSMKLAMFPEKSKIACSSIGLRYLGRVGSMDPTEFLAGASFTAIALLGLLIMQRNTKANVN
jgi:hypothetical protein